MSNNNQEVNNEKFKVCTKCKRKLLATREYFSTQYNGKYGLRSICLDCSRKIDRERTINKIKSRCKNNEINEIELYELFLNSNDRYMPKFMYNKDTALKLTRYVFLNKLNCKTKEELISNFTSNNLIKYRLNTMYYKYIGTIKDTISKTFYEFNISKDDFIVHKDEDIIKEIDRFIQENNLTIYDILNSNYKQNKYINAVISNKNIIKNDLFIWYFNEKGIKHPLTNEKICDYHFRILIDFPEINTIINKIKFYCEHECEESIVDFYNDTDKIKIWIKKYFCQRVSKSINPCVKRYFETRYEALIKCYPHIKEDHILFDWEWMQFNDISTETLCRELRDFILYRMQDCIHNLKDDIPKNMNCVNMKILQPKFNKHIHRNRFKNYYEWCCLAFPEYKDSWTEQMFDETVANDGVKCNSFEEKLVYEHIKDREDTSLIQCVSLKRAEDYRFVDNESNNTYYPDFIITKIIKNGREIELKTPIIIEYFGMYSDKNNNDIYVKYREKTKYKIKYFSSLNNYIFLDLYQKDLIRNYENIDKKLNKIIEMLKV